MPTDTRLGITAIFTSRGFEQVNAQFRTLANSIRGFRELGQTLTFGLTLPIAMFARSLLNSGVEFSAHINAIRGAIESAGGAAVDMAAVQARIMEMSREWYKTPTELAAGMERLAHAFGETFSNDKEMLDFFNVAVRLSTAAQMDMERTSSQLIQIMNMFSIPMANASAAADVLTNAFIQTTAEMEDLMVGMRYIGPYANAAGLSFNATAAALGFLSQAGMSASMAGTSLRNIIQQLLAPTGRWAAVLRSVGGGFQYTNGYLNFEEMLNRMQRAMARGLISPAEIMGLVGKRGAPAFLALIAKGGEAFHRFVEETRRAGTTEEYARRQLEGLSGSFNKFLAAWERFKISLTEGGLGVVLAKVLQFFAWLLDLLSEIPDDIWTFIGAVAAMTAIIGPLIYMIGALKVALLALGANPVMLTITLIVILIAGLYMALKPVYDEWVRVSRITDKAKRSFENLSIPLQYVLIMVRSFGAVWDWIGNSIDEAITDMRNFGNMAKRVADVVSAAWDVVTSNSSNRASRRDALAAAIVNAQSSVDVFYNAPHMAGTTLASQLNAVFSGRMWIGRIEIQPSTGLNAIIQGVQQHGAHMTGHGVQLVALPPTGDVGNGLGVGGAPIFNPNLNIAQGFVGALRR